MANLNKVMLIGNLTRDPEIKFTPKGTAVAQLGLAINRKFKVGDEMREETTFVDMEAWGKQAETIGKHCVKGSSLYVEGRLQLDTWEDKTSGQKRSKMKVVVEDFQFVGAKREGGASGNSQPAQRQQPPARPAGNAQGAPVDDDDIPF